MQPSNFADALSFCVFQNTRYREINFVSKQLYFQSSIGYIEISAATWGSYFLAENLFFRTPSCLEQLVSNNNTSELQILFSDQLLKINTFSVELLLRRSYFFRISKFSINLLFRSKYFFRAAAEEKLFRSKYFWKTVTFLWKASSA